MAKFLMSLNALVWGAPALLLILGVGLFYSLRLSFFQLRFLPRAFRLFFAGQKEDNQGTSPFRALCTALAATVGTGNIVGVAGAICLGGPGAIFWMWVSGILGMITKYAEVVLSCHFRVRTKTGWAGGPMYVMTQGLGQAFRPMAWLYSLFGLIAAFGVGNAAQVNALVTGVHSVLALFGKTPDRTGDVILGILLAAAIGTLLLGGAKRIGAAAEMLVPILCAGYIGLCILVLVLRAEAIPAAFSAILEGAFCPRAATGGFLGSALTALRVGCSRGVFTNEAGMGTAAMAHASADLRHPAEQGLLGCLEVFLDTILICSLTALVILTSGVNISYGVDAGGTLTSAAFTAVCGKAAAVFLAIAMALLALATVLGWGLYGGRCAEFLFGSGAWKPFALAQGAAALLGTLTDTAAVWRFSETVNGLMAVPNLITLAVLSPVVIRLTKEYLRKSGGQAAKGGTYADFHQRQPL